MTKTDRFKQLFKKEILAVGIVGAILFFTIIFSIIVLIMRAGKVKVEVHVAPYDAQLILNETEIKNNKKIYLEPGKYHLSAKRDHFDDLEIDFQVSKDLPYVVAVMNPSDEEGEKYITSHNAEFRRVEGFVGTLMNKSGELERKKYPILKYLPINNRFYSISYSYPDYVDGSDTGEPVILVKADSAYIDTAVAKMKTFEGVSLIDYEINFNLDNKFKNPSSSTSSDAEKFLKESYKNSGYNLSSVEHLSDNYAVGIFTITDKHSLMPSSKHLALIHKEGEQWSIVATPQPLLTKQNTPDTPDDILNAANSFAGQ